MKLLIERGASVNNALHSHETPLHETSKCYSVMPVKLLIVNETNVGAVTAWGVSFLFMSIVGGPVTHQLQDEGDSRL